jgi:predicted Ser/Thr protein kinase
MWARTGLCSYAGRCRFAHGEQELGPVSSASTAAASSPSESAASSQVLVLERDQCDSMLKEAEERACQAQRRAAEREVALLDEAEALRILAAEREVALHTVLRRAEEAEARAAELERQLSWARQDAGAADARSLSQVLSGETSTASFAELEAATGGFAASRILGRGGFGPVYRGEWSGQAVAIKRLDQVRPSLFT